jgi:hypothetical protein
MLILLYEQEISICKKQQYCREDKLNQNVGMLIRQLKFWQVFLRSNLKNYFYYKL